MKVLLSSAGTRGDVQPLLALALELRALGHESQLCVRPRFKDWVESCGFPHAPLGLELDAGNGARPLSAEQTREYVVRNLHAHFLNLTEAARGCMLIFGSSFAARSVAEALSIPHVFVHFNPVLPSPYYPAPLPGHHFPQTLPASTNLQLWAQHEQLLNDHLRAPLNEERRRLGLAPVESVLRHKITDSPWLAADPTLGPAAGADIHSVKTGAWLRPDNTPLPDPLDRFLADGEPPIYFGFGSMPAMGRGSEVFIEAARALGLRSVISRGWGNLAAIDAATDHLSIGDVSHERLFSRVTAVVHHGGAGTTTAAALAGCPQVIVPHACDQDYWAHRVQQLGVGISGPTIESLTADGLICALRRCLQPEVKTRAQQLAPRIQRNGAHLAARLVEREFT